MPEIGATLREARTRARIDIAEIETATKIRAKYLRALENEEWDLLPGPTFVKTFLRTYAEALGLDAKLLVDEYKLRHERLADLELRPISPRTQAAAGRGRMRMTGPVRRVGGGGRSARGPVIVILVLLVLGILAVLGVTQGDEQDRVATQPPSTTATTTRRTSSTATPTAPKPKPKRRLARLRVLPTGTVNVCLRAKGQGVLIDGKDLAAGDNSPTFRSSRFTITLGTNAARLRWNGKTFRPPASARPIGYAFTPTARRRLSADQQPTCG